MKVCEKGFTLIELLVVIVIIGVLAALLLPAVWGVQARARSAQCKSNLHQIYVAMEVYRGEWDGFYPFAADVPSLKLNTLPRIADVLAKDAGNPKVFQCPGDKMGYFDREGSSYEFNGRLGGRQVLGGRFATVLGDTRVIEFYDYEDFHGKKGTPGSRNYVFVDGHIEGSLAWTTDTQSEAGQ